MQNNMQKQAMVEMFQLLAEFYKYPNREFYEYISEENIQEELKQLVNGAGMDFAIQIYKPFASFDEMRIEYTRAFIGIDKPAATPVESIYKVWTTDETATMAFAKSKGYLMGDSALHVQHLLEKFQLEIPEELGKKPDHISVLLELQSYILEHESDEAALQFAKDHFDWIRDFKQEIEKVEGHEFYIYTTELLIDVIEETKVLLTKNIK
ncbi:TorD/DmsD family molecular chaperone [Desulfuribacillus alkaliarsenatis]|uniref:Uncharacterized protein n=1 Tax=Desulfuribacillus alkaliarsenatis TaxID=766136 RepID=A0A1E5G1G2_9FIRM|nr:molecular chaperone TorD family protein [Desulfuribacillus alkaliarsenatis]OEF96748.1 hypothetical protein BHF68_06660 [Desulfuribacillus alkaliarsenatis]